MPRIPLNMPKMSMTMEFGTVVEWLVAVGDRVRNGDAVVVVTTDKVDMEVEATFEGVLEEILAQEGDQLAVGQPMAYLQTEAEDLLGDLFAPPPTDPTATTTPASDVPAAALEDGGEVDAPHGHDEPVRAVPLARRIASEADVDLRTVAPTGPARTIRARDVREAIAERERRPAGPAVATPEPPVAPVAPAGSVTPAPAVVVAGALLGDDRTRRLRVATAKVMSASAAIPQFTVYRVLDLGRMARAREASLKGVGWTSILVRAYALVLREFPQLNGSWTEQGVQANDAVAVALAVDTEWGLLAPVLSEPDRVTLRELDRRLREVAETIKRGETDPGMFSGATGTVSNLGGMGVDRFNALLTPPQPTALSLGTVGPRPAVDADGGLTVRISCEVGLTVDHRAADGADAARALDALQAFLADPVLLLA